MLHESSLPSGITTQPLPKTSLVTLPLKTVAISLWIDWMLFKIRFCLPYSRKALIYSGEVKELHAVYGQSINIDLVYTLLALLLTSSLPHMV